MQRNLINKEIEEKRQLLVAPKKSSRSAAFIVIILITGSPLFFYSYSRRGDLHLNLDFDFMTFRWWCSDCWEAVSTQTTKS